MSQATDADEPEETATECIEPGCDDDATHVAPVTDNQYVPRTVGYRLTCEDHADEDAWDLRSVDLRGYDRMGLDDDAWPPELQRLQGLGSVLDWYVKPPRLPGSDPYTISTVTRDAETREIRGEGTLHPTTGIFALVRVKPDDRDLEAVREEYVREAPDVPDWLEWQYCDSPIDHLINGVRCADCGEEHTTNRGMPGNSELQWRYLHHRGDCPHADEQDKEIWAEKQLAQELYERPSPRSMALDCIWAELAELHELWHSDHGGYLTDALDHRSGKFESVLEERLNPRYPACPNCGARDWRRDPEGDWIESCGNCLESPDHDDHEDVYVQYREQRKRLWGWRGHGSRGRDPDEED